MKKKKQNNVPITEVFIPPDYFELNVIEKESICLVLMDNILQVINREFPIELNRFDLLEQILESSIITNTEAENYEVCQVLKDIKELIYE
jgi:hypothetical protein